MLAGRNGARGRIRTCTGDALDVVSLRLDYASEMDGAPCRCCPGTTCLQRKPAGCCLEAKGWWAATVLPRVLRFKRPLHHSLMLAARTWSQSPVLPWAQRAYETCLSAGPTAFELWKWSPHPELHQAGLLTEQAHRSKCFGGIENGRRETTWTSKAAWF